MRMNLLPDRWLLVPFVLPLALTALTLVRVGTSRGTPRGPIVLTERNASLTPATPDNSAASLRMNWRPAPAAPDTWLDRAKLAELGFDVSLDPGDPGAQRRYGRALSREVFVAFEVRRDRDLVPVDAARRAEALAARYADAGHVIVAATIRPSVHRQDGRHYLIGSVVNIDPSRIHVPPALAAGLAPPFEVVVNYGSHWEPFVVSVSRGSASR